MPKIYRVSGATPITVAVQARQGSELYAELWYDEDPAHWRNLVLDRYTDDTSEWTLGPLANAWAHDVRLSAQPLRVENIKFDSPLKDDFTFDLDARVGSLSGGPLDASAVITVTQGGKEVRPVDGESRIFVGQGLFSAHWEKLIFQTV